MPKERDFTLMEALGGTGIPRRDIIGLLPE